MNKKFEMPDFSKMTNEEWAEWKKIFDQMGQQSKAFEEKNKKELQDKAFNEIKTAIDNHFSVLGADTLTDWLNTNKYIVLPKVAVAVGRRKITEDTLLFSYPYKKEGGEKQMHLKLDEESKMPTSAQYTYKVIQQIRKKKFDDIKDYFTAKGHTFIHTKDGKKWLKVFFPNVLEELEAEEEEA